MSDLPRSVEDLSAERRALFELLLKEQRQRRPAARTQTISRRKALDSFPLSFSQQRLWFLNQLAPGSPVYNIPVAVRWRDPLNLGALEQSIHEIIRRHDVLRATFVEQAGQPIQSIRPSLSICAPLLDLRALDSAERESATLRLAAEEGQRPFDLERGPLLRVTLLRLGVQEHVLLLTMHHIVSDGWSTKVLIRELATLYRAFCAGQPSPLPDLPIQYTDFAAWSQQRLQDDLLETQLAYWRRALNDAPPLLALPADHPRPPIQSFRGSQQRIALSSELSAELAALSQQSGATLFMTVLAAYQALLARYSGQTDIVIGAPIAGRTHTETMGLIGLFVNILALRTDLSGNPSFAELLERARQAALGAYAHQDVPFEYLVKDLQPERTLSYAPLVQALCAVQTALPASQDAGDALDFLQVSQAATQFDLSLHLWEIPDGMDGFLEYSVDLFDSTTIARMRGHIQILLRGIVADPTRRLADLPLLTEAERQQLVVMWNGARATYRVDTRLQDLFEEQAARAPDAVAVVYAEQHLTYAALDRFANRLAHALQAQGVGPEACVGLAMEHSLELVIGLLAILKAGGAYLPLDPSHPAERIAFMLGDASARALITARHDRRGDQGAGASGQDGAAPAPDPRSLPAGPWSVVDLRADWARIAALPDTPPPNRAPTDNLAYIIYTSGSTGSPKGVMVGHAAVVQLLRATQDRFAFTSADVWALFHSVAFDFSVWEVWGALGYGGRLVVTPYWVSRTPEAFYALIQSARVTVLNQTPSAFRAFIQADAQRRAALSLRLVIFGGEALDPHSLQPWYDRRPDRLPQLVNMYGITETTVHVTYRALAAADAAGRAGSPIGRAIPDLAVYVLDRYRRLAPIGVPGELYVGGSGLARGYLGRPDLTAERFVPNPFVKASGVWGLGSDSDPRSPSPDPRLYRTGDLARYLPDGELVYLGRIDQQVKLRGYRIELDEIAAALRLHPAVRTAVVALRGERLVAYVVTSDELRVTSSSDSSNDEGSAIDDAPLSSLVLRPSSFVAELRAFLAERLPDYMLPGAFVVLDALPLTANGKVDRRALPAPDSSRSAASDAFAAPRTPAEDLLAQIWADVLRIDRVGADDNFFALGGHSLLATQVVARVRELFQVDLPVRALFEAPTVAALAERVARAATAAQGLQIPPLRPVARDAPLPLSFAQQRMWFLDQLQPNSPAYHLPIALRLAGALDLAALRWSLNEITRRHEILRTSFPSVDGRPVQRIDAPRDAPLPLLDLVGIAASEREALARRLATAEARRPFDLAHGPLIRAALLRLAPADHMLILSLHHIIADGWSMDVLVTDCMALYAAASAGHPPSLPALPIQYADYAAWQRAWLRGETLESQLSYWRRQLADPPALALPADRLQPPIQSFRGARQRFALPDELSAGIMALSRQAGATVFMTLLAAFQVLLARYTEQNDIAVGTPIAGRSQRETERLIGCFVNTLVIRTDLSRNPTFHEALGRVREVALDAYAHQHIPFEQVVEALHPERDMSRSPLFNAMFVLQNAPLAPLKLPDVQAGLIEIDPGTAKFDLSLTLAEAGAGLIGTLEYRSDLFDATTIARLIAHFRSLAAGAVAGPRRPVSDLSLLGSAERQQILVEWNDTVVAARSRESEVRRFASGAALLHELMAAQAARTPDAVAVILETMNDEDRTMKRPDAPFIVHRSSFIVQISYAELDRRANQLARHLKALGVGPEARVGLCLERSPELLIALLGVLKAGGAYVPLDPSYPPERLAFMLEDSQARVILTKDEGRKTKDGLTAFAPRPSSFVDLGADWPRIARQPADPPRSGARPGNLAYVIYTSGSTGQPKGALVSHANVARLLAITQPAFQFSGADVWTLFHSYAFDFAVWEIWGSLLYGGRLVIVPAPISRAPDQFAQLLARERVSVLNQTPSAVRQLVAGGGQALRALALRLVIFGGEALAVEPLRAWPAGANAAPQFVNMYGITETTVHTTIHRLRPADLRPGAPGRIGRPLPDMQAYVVDRAGHLTPAGVAGELWIGGAGLARGYLGRPDLTAERFIPNPFTQGSGVWGLGSRGWDQRSAGKGQEVDSDPRTLHPEPRLYRTGDRARWLADGTLEYLGRIDQQVKLRGYRIELEEIAAALRQHAAVRQAVVALRDERLVAYIVQGSGVWGLGAGNPASEILIRDPRSLIPDLRAFLAERLPGYMIPAAFVLLDALPLTPSGKLDRRALPSPDSGRSAASDTFVAPRTPAEDLLAQIWADVLRIDRVGVNDDFFALGGHSLLATQVIARVREAFAVDLPLRILFEAPSVAALAAQITAARSAGMDPQTPPLRPDPRTGALPLSFAQQRLWFFDQLRPGSAAYNISAAVQMAGEVDLRTLRRSLHAIVQRHEALRTTFAAVDGQPVQRIGAAQLPPLPLLDLQALPERARNAATRDLAEAEAQRPFDLARGPLLRITLLRVRPPEYVALLTMHHIIADAWSIEILIREIAALYAAFTAGRPDPLPDLPIQYADYAAWQRGWLRGSALDAHLAYWTRQLADLPALDLPTDFPRPPIESARGAHHRFTLPAPLHDGLVALSRAAGATLFMTVLAAWQALLARYSGQSDLAVGTPIANRGQAETEPLIGLFLNTLVLRADLAGGPPFNDLLRRTRAVCLDAYAHQDLPFERLVEALAPTRDLSRHPLFQVMCTLEHAPPETLAQPDIALRPLEIAHGAVHFDLSLALAESDAQMRGVLRYRTDLFEAATIARMLGHLQTLLAGVLADPERRLADLPLLTSAERQQLAVEWNATQTPYPADRCIYQLFEDQAARSPDAIAAIDATTQLTYAELNARANQLARYLRRLGIAPEAPVATCMERATPLLVALLGIFKSGGSYLPLNPRFPAERLRFMLEDSRARVLLIDDVRLTIDDLQESGAAIVNLRTDWPAVARMPRANLGNAADPAQLAYLIYTSGTTGRPKAVLVEHRGLINTLCASQARYQFGEQDRHVALVSFAFDISLFEVFSPLLVGGALALAAEEQVLDLPQMIAILRDVTFFHSTPGLLRQIVDFILAAGRPAWYARVRQIAVGGDVIPPALIDDVQQAFPAAQVYLGYGPTEATIMTTNYAVTGVGLPRAYVIGRPMHNMQVLLYDRQGRLAPIGVPGELHIGGPGVARGYLGRPDLTAERFVPNPFGTMNDEDRTMNEPNSSFIVHRSSFGARLYKTGDMARYRPDGNIEFLGRIDDQVKLRGYRIELGEIAAVLGAHPAVRQCVVAAQADASGENRLAAYIVQGSGVGSQGSGVPASDDLIADHRSLIPALREWLAVRLPDYMIPSAFVLLDALPLTAHGKIDRSRLPAPDIARADAAAAFVAPRTAIEERLAGIWSAILGIERVGVHDDFFALGGHSLLAIQLIAHLRQAFPIELALRKLFEASTIAELAEIIEGEIVAKLDELSEEDALKLL